jgi:hypothetical protein
MARETSGGGNTGGSEVRDPRHQTELAIEVSQHLLELAKEVARSIGERVQKALESGGGLPPL